MSRYSVSATNFTAGEISPRLLGRTDYAKYANGCKSLKNMLIMPHGGATRRPGTHYVAEVKDSSKAVRLVRFVPSVSSAYILEFGDLYIRFYRNHGQIVSGTPVEVTTTYTQSEIFDLSVVASVDVLYIAHPSHKPAKLSRLSDTSWSLADVTFNEPPMLDVNATTMTMTPSVTTGNGTVTASASYFAATDVGRYIRIKNGATYGYCILTSYVSATVMNMTVINAFPATTANATWSISPWSATLGYPRAVTFYEDRLWFGGSASEPETIWSSNSSDYENFSRSNTAGTVVDTSGIVATLASDQVNTIRWMRGDPSSFLIGTSSGEWAIGASTNDEAITPSNRRARQQTTRGCSGVAPIKIDGSTIYTQTSGRKVRELSMSESNFQFVSSDITILSEHITFGGVKQIAYQQEPYNVIWVTLLNGNCVGITFNKEQSVVAWHRQMFGGTDALLQSAECIPAPDGTYDETWVVVERTINGVTKQYVEYLEKEYDPEDTVDTDGCFFVDSGLEYSGASTLTLSGLTHLANETVAILADGTIHPDKTVSAGGVVTLDRAVTTAIVGLPYTSELIPVDPEAGADRGTSQGQMKRVHKLEIRFYKTLAADFGRDEDTLEPVLFRDASVPMGSPTPLFTGIKSLDFPGEYERELGVLIRQDKPLPLTVLSIVYNGVTR